MNFFHFLLRLLYRSSLRQLKGQSLISINDLSTDDIMMVMKLSQKYEMDLKSKRNQNCTLFQTFWNYLNPIPLTQHRPMIGLLFFESSTRTRCSFETAAKRLGCGTILLSDMQSSSINKGETLEDTVQMFQRYCDALVIRHQQKGVITKLKGALPSNYSILNAGDGAGEHPTQALLDLYTIMNEFPDQIYNFNKKPLNIALIGDLKNGRTTHSLAKLLIRFNVKLQFFSPIGLEMPNGVIQEILHDPHNKFPGRSDLNCPTHDLISVLKSSDVIYSTRIQTERFEQNEELITPLNHGYIITDKLLNQYSPPHQIVMHPLPRNNEITNDVDQNQRQRYFKQAENGVYVRMALLSLYLGL